MTQGFALTEMVEQMVRMSLDSLQADHLLPIFEIMWCFGMQMPFTQLCTWVLLYMLILKYVMNPKFKWKITNYIYYCTLYLSSFSSALVLHFKPHPFSE